MLDRTWDFVERLEAFRDPGLASPPTFPSSEPVAISTSLGPFRPTSLSAKGTCEWLDHVERILAIRDYSSLNSLGQPVTVS